jgi:transcriptional regulator with XRE-family HTH domain
VDFDRQSKALEATVRRRDQAILRARKAGLSLRQIADAVGITNPRVQQILNRERE